jgi:hypothetical protein
VHLTGAGLLGGSLDDLQVILRSIGAPPARAAVGLRTDHKARKLLSRCLLQYQVGAWALTEIMFHWLEWRHWHVSQGRV